MTEDELYKNIITEFSQFCFHGHSYLFRKYLKDFIKALSTENNYVPNGEDRENTDNEFFLDVCAMSPEERRKMIMTLFAWLIITREHNESVYRQAFYAKAVLAALAVYEVLKMEDNNEQA